VRRAKAAADAAGQSPLAGESYDVTAQERKSITSNPKPWHPKPCTLIPKPYFSTLDF